MNVFLYIMIFIAGTVFGSFFSLAVYRIPRKENIVYVQSHCTTCNHKLSFWDLIPILSYIFLRGRCRYCHDKIRARYILLEIFSGLVFLLIALSFRISIFSTLQEFVLLFLTYLFIAGLFIIGGIDKENFVIMDNVCLYLIFISCLKLLFLGVTNQFVWSHLLGFICVPIFLFLIDFVVKIDKTKEEPIGLGDIKYLAIIGLFLGIEMQLLIGFLSFFLAGIGVLIHHFKQIPWGYYLSIASIIMILIQGYFQGLMPVISFGK